MAEETTTPVPVEAGAQAQPAEPVTTEAVETTAPATEEQTEEAQAGASDEDAELTSWAEKKGLELDSDNTKKAAKMAREAEKAFHAKSQKASELEKAASVTTEAEAKAVEQYAANTGQDPEMVKAVRELQTEKRVREFWDSPNVDRKFEKAMVETLQARPDLKNDLESLYALSVVRSGGVAAVQSQAKIDTLSELAQKQQATSPKGNATTRTAPKQKEFKDLSIKEMEAQLGFVRR